jgi:sigma-B regulation protein RsbU (phosphoserine phosphatase)
MTTTITMLPAQDHSPATARRTVRQTLTEAGLEVILDDALLLVSELVTDAFLHAGTEVHLHIDIGPGHARVEVIDHGPGRLVRRDSPDDSSQDGHAILLLDALAKEWGTRHFGGGNSVWFLVGVTDVVRSRPLPVRPPGPGAAPPPPTVSWLLGLPADLEERISSAQLIAELLHRLCVALGLGQGWLFSESVQDDGQWSVAAAHDPSGVPPGIDAVRRLAREGADQAISDGGGLLVLPLRQRTGVFGALVVGDAAHLDETGVALSRLVGDRMGVVLRDDRTYAAQLRDRSSLALLAEAGELFAGTLDVTLAVTLAAQLVVPRFATWAAVYLTDEGGTRLATVAHEQEADTAALRDELAGDAAQALAQQLVRELGDGPTLVPAHRIATSLAGTVGEVLAVPLVARRRLLGFLLAGRASGSGYVRDEAGLLIDLARRAALAVDNARLYQERTAVAQALQNSLLPPALPTVAYVEFGARYTAAGEGNQVGGDFYDVFELPHGQWAVAIGDVCGKGPEAAAITGLARNVLRLLGRDDIAPPAILRRLNAAILDLGDRGRFCTATMATVRASSAGLTVRLSAAGHPLPVLVTAAGEVSLVGTYGSLLGVLDDVSVPVDELVLAPGDALVFYTDGVTERRNGERMLGDDTLLTICAAAAGSTADTFAGLVEEGVRAFGEEASRDDLAVLVVRATG